LIEEEEAVKDNDYDYNYDYDYKTGQTTQTDVDIGEYYIAKNYGYIDGYSRYPESEGKLTSWNTDWDDEDYDAIYRSDDRVRNIKRSITDTELEMQYLQDEYMDAEAEGSKMIQDEIRRELQVLKGKLADLREELLDAKSAYDRF